MCCRKWLSICIALLSLTPQLVVYGQQTQPTGLPAVYFSSKEKLPQTKVKTKVRVKTENFSGSALIGIRGSSSASHPKKSYSVQFVNDKGEPVKVSFLGLPAESDWILYAPYSDKSLIRDVLTYQLARKSGHYAPRTVFVELYLNDSYNGVYVLEEKIKISSSRLNIAGNSSGSTVPYHSYLLKLDRASSEEKFLNKKRVGRMVKESNKALVAGKSSWNTINRNLSIPPGQFAIESNYLPLNATWQTTEIRYVDPEHDELTAEQKKYVADLFKKVEDAFYRKDYNAYSKLIDTRSFADYFLLTELSRNVDGYRLSTFMHIKPDGKLYMGPAWDYNIAYGNADYCNANLTAGWVYKFNDECSSHAWLVPFWWNALLSDSNFTSVLSCRWKDLRNSAFETNSIIHAIREMETNLGAAAQKNFGKWPILGKDIEPNAVVFKTYHEEIKYLEQFITQRLKWMDENLPGSCNGKATSIAD